MFSVVSISRMSFRLPAKDSGLPFRVTLLIGYAPDRAFFLGVGSTPWEAFLNVNEKAASHLGLDVNLLLAMTIDYMELAEFTMDNDLSDAGSYDDIPF